jgi:large subunit ribosomal protein L18
MEKSQYKNQMRVQRHKRLRHKVSGTALRPRLSVFRSNTTLYAQLIDDTAGKTLASADSRKITQGTPLQKRISWDWISLKKPSLLQSLK